MSTADAFDPRTEDTADAFERALQKLRTEGIEVATQAAIDLCANKDGPAQARSAAVNAIFRAAGLFDKREDDGDGGVHPSEMTAKQLEKEIFRMQREYRGLAPACAASQPEDLDQGKPAGARGRNGDKGGVFD